MKNILRDNIAHIPKAKRNKIFLSFSIITAVVLFFAGTIMASATSTASVTLPFSYTFNSDGTVYSASSPSNSTSPYWWVDAGAPLVISNGVGSNNSQNIFLMLSRFTPSTANLSVQEYVNRVSDNLSNTSNRQPYIGESLIARYVDANNYYYAGIRADGQVVIKKKTNGIYQTMASKKIFAGTYNQTSNYDLIPLNKWIGLKLVVTNNASGQPTLSLYTDVGQTGVWQLTVSAVDDSAVFGPGITSAGLVGIENDYANAQFDNISIIATSAGTAVLPPPPVSTTTTTSYDATVLSNNPVMYLTMGSPSSGSESDKTGRGHTGTYVGGTPSLATLPNGDSVSDFNGTTQYLTVPSSADLSIPTTHQMTWEAWIRPDTLQFPVASGDGYIDWMGKCENYSPTCEWEARMYSSDTTQGRPDRLSAYVFNQSAGLGSAADWQPASGVIQSGEWIHVVAEYQTQNTPSGCSSAYPGSINIWVNGVEQSFASHTPTGCMSQYNITPKAGNSPLDIGTMAFDTWFKGAIGKVAVYNYLLTPSQISAHFQAMTGGTPSGSCGATCTIPLTP